MKLTRVTPNLVQLTRYGLVNCYFVLESDGITLVDTGLSGSGDDILKASRTVGAQIHRILLTHAHVDHIGSLDDLAMKLGKFDVAIGAREARLLKKDMTLDPAEPQVTPKGGYPGATTTPTHFVADGELYGSLRVLATPGHTPGHMAFLDERDGTLLTGDAFTTIRELRVAGDAPWTFPLPNFACWHKPTALASAERLLQLTRDGLVITRYAAGHGAVRDGGVAALQTALAHANHQTS